MKIARFLVLGFLGLVLLTHGLIHLMMPSVWGGVSPLLGAMSADTVATMVNVLLGTTILCYTVAAGGIVGIPVLKQVWMEASAIGSIASLAMFAMMWNALTPDSLPYVFGPIVSFIVLILVSFHYWKVKGADSRSLTVAQEAQ